MSTDEFMAVVISICLLSLLLGFLFGRDYANTKRARCDLADADKMRAAIRAYDDRVSEFAPSIVRHAQSEPQHERLAGARTTAFASLPPHPQSRTEE